MMRNLNKKRKGKHQARDCSIVMDSLCAVSPLVDLVVRMSMVVDVFVALFLGPVALSIDVHDNSLGWGVFGDPDDLSAGI